MTEREGYPRLIRYESSPGGNAWEERVTFLESPDHLRELVAQLWQSSRAELYDILSPGGDVLQMGLGKRKGCATYGTWLMVKEGRATRAVGDENAADDAEPEAVFLSGAGGEPNDVGLRNLLSLSELQRIAVYFFQTADVPRDILWE
jgi:hypothetical protein